MEGDPEVLQWILNKIQNRLNHLYFLILLCILTMVFIPNNSIAQDEIIKNVSSPDTIYFGHDFQIKITVYNNQSDPFKVGFGVILFNNQSPVLNDTGTVYFVHLDRDEYLLTAFQTKEITIRCKVNKLKNISVGYYSLRIDVYKIENGGATWEDYKFVNITIADYPKSEPNLFGSPWLSWLLIISGSITVFIGAFNEKDQSSNISTAMGNIIGFGAFLGGLGISSINNYQRNLTFLSFFIWLTIIILIIIEQKSSKDNIRLFGSYRVTAAFTVSIFIMYFWKWALIPAILAWILTYLFFFLINRYRNNNK